MLRASSRVGSWAGASMGSVQSRGGIEVSGPSDVQTCCTPLSLRACGLGTGEYRSQDCGIHPPSSASSPVHRWLSAETDASLHFDSPLRAPRAMLAAPKSTLRPHPEVCIGLRAVFACMSISGAASGTEMRASGRGLPGGNTCAANVAVRGTPGDFTDGNVHATLLESAKASGCRRKLIFQRRSVLHGNSVLWASPHQGTYGGTHDSVSTPKLGLPHH